MDEARCPLLRRLAPGADRGIAPSLHACRLRWAGGRYASGDWEEQEGHAPGIRGGCRVRPGPQYPCSGPAVRAARSVLVQCVVCWFSLVFAAHAPGMQLRWFRRPCCPLGVAVCDPWCRGMTPSLAVRGSEWGSRPLSAAAGCRRALCVSGRVRDTRVCGFPPLRRDLLRLQDACSWLPALR